MTSTENNSNGNGNGNSLKLYYWYTSFYSQRVLMALYEKRVPFKTRVVNLSAMEQYEPWFLRLNPRAEVPVLTDGVKVIPDSVRIVEYLEDNFSNGIPEGLRCCPWVEDFGLERVAFYDQMPIKCYTLQSKVLYPGAMLYINGDFGQLTPKEKGSEESKKIQKYRDLLESLAIPVITFGSATNPDFLDNPKPPFTPVVIKRLADFAKNRPTVIRDFAERTPEFREKLLEKAREVEEGSFKQVQSKKAVEKVLTELEGVLQTVEDELASHTDDQCEWWLCGAMLSIADIDLAILLNRLYQLGFECRYWAQGKRPHLEAYWERIQQRSSFKRATYFSANAVRLTMLRGALKGKKGLLASLTAAIGVAVVSYIVYRRVQKS